MLAIGYRQTKRDVLAIQRTGAADGADSFGFEGHIKPGAILRDLERSFHGAVRSVDGQLPFAGQFGGLGGLG